MIVRYIRPGRLTAADLGVPRTRKVLSEAVLSFVCLLVVTSPTFSSDLRGNFQFSGVRTNNAGAFTESFDQRHSLGLSRNLTPFLSLNGYFGFSRFTSELGEGGNIWRRQLSPTADLRWAHPLVTAGVSYQQRRLSSDNATTDIVLSGLEGDIALQKEEWPYVTLRLTSDKSHNRFDRNTRDVRGHSVQLVVQHSIRQSRVSYAFNAHREDIYSSNTRTASTDHRLSWTQLFNSTNGRFRSRADYRFSHRRLSDRLITEDRSIRTIDFLTALYAHDATPDLGALQPVATLSDGNRAEPSEPPIKIGRGSVDQNVGLDFGYARRVDGLYIYTDRPSGSGASWEVWTSFDNETWNHFFAGVSVSYNAAFSRYEILFDSVFTRYVKAVNFGTNDILEVLVSEIEALEEFTRDSETNREQTVHDLSVSNSYQIRANIRMTLDLDLRTEPGGSFGTSRDQFFSTCSASHELSERVSHGLRLQLGWNKFNLAANDQRDLTLSYSAIITPIETVHFRLGANSNQSATGPHSIQELNGITAHSTWQLYPGLSMQLDGRYARNNLYAAGRVYDSWTYGVSSQATLKGGIRLAVASQYRSSVELTKNERRIRRSLDGTIDINLTRSITISSRVALNDDEDYFNMSQLHSMSWRMSQSLTFGGQIDLTRTSTGDRIERTNLRLNCQLSGRTNVYAGGTKILTDNAVDRKLVSVQLGLRSGF